MQCLIQTQQGQNLTVDENNITRSYVGTTLTYCANLKNVDEGSTLICRTSFLLDPTIYTLTRVTVASNTPEYDRPEVIASNITPAYEPIWKSPRITTYSARFPSNYVIDECTSGVNLIPRETPFTSTVHSKLY